MKIFLLTLLLVFASNTDIPEVAIGSSDTVTIYLSRDKDTYFYLRNEKGHGETIYFYFLFDSKPISRFQACGTSTGPTRWGNTCNGISGNLTESNDKQKSGKYAFYQSYYVNANITYLTVKYPPSPLSKFEVKISYKDIDEQESKENERAFLTGLMIFVYIVIPVIALAIIITIIVCCCICMRKRKTQGMVFNQPPNMANMNYNPMTYSSNIASTPVTQENLIYNKPA